MSSDLRIKKIISEAFGSGELSRDRINFAVRCPSCEESNSKKKKLVIRIDDGRYQCWVCGIKGKNVLNLIKKHRPELSDKLGIKFKKSDTQEEVSISLPPDKILLFNYRGNDPDVLSVISYVKNRGINTLQMARWRMMTCKTGKFRRRVLIPSFDVSGKLNYYVSRAIDDTTLRYRNARVKKVEIIFNEIDIDWSKPVILVEGVFDSIKSPENCIPLLGSTLSKNSLLFQKLVQNQSEVFLSLDPDMKEKAYVIANSLTRMGCPVHVSFAPKDNDIGSMTKDEVLKLLNSSVTYNNHTGLYYKIGNIRSGSVI